MTRVVRMGVLMLVLLLVVSGCTTAPAAKPEAKPATPAAPAAATQAKVAVIGPFTGPLAASAGREGKEGTQLGAKIANQAAGEKGVKIVLDFLDDRGDAQEAVVLAQKVANDKSYVAVMGHFSTDACFAAMPIYEKAGMAMLTPWASHEEITKRSKVSFRMSTASNIFAPANCDILVDDLKAKKIAVLLANSEYPKSQLKYMKEYLPKRGASIIAEEYYMMGDTDFKGQLTNISQKKPDAICAIGFSAEAPYIIKQAREMGIKTPITMTPAAMSPQLTQIAGANLQDVWIGWSSPATFALLTGGKTTNEAAVKFMEAFNKEYSKSPSGLWDAQSYDMVLALSSVVNKVGVDRAKVLDGLAKLRDFKSVNGLMFGEDRALIPELGVLKYDPAKKAFSLIRTMDVKPYITK